jgi:hypothetical protein
MTGISRIESLLALNKSYALLGEWDRRFLLSLETQLASGRALSVRQNNILQKIEAKLSPSAINAAQEWAAQWDGEKQATATICAKYYVDNGYFVELARKILRDPTTPIPQKQYEKMCGNKYAQKVLAATQADPQYPPGTPVMLRATAKSTLTATRYNKFKEKPLFVLEVLPHVLRAAKGAKIYKVLSGTSTDLFEIEERFLKIYRHRA